MGTKACHQGGHGQQPEVAASHGGGWTEPSVVLGLLILAQVAHLALIWAVTCKAKPPYICEPGFGGQAKPPSLQRTLRPPGSEAACTEDTVVLLRMLFAYKYMCVARTLDMDRF